MVLGVVGKYLPIQSRRFRREGRARWDTHDQRKFAFLVCCLDPVLTTVLADIRADSLLEMIKFFAALVLNADEATV